mmetsp:Transcript_12932/g.17625  ORF Transcript_12932/g.17625 Transcript_12932/m.17625 type:complete len:383 (-) Transcript_12932:1967-3115(-)
MMTNFASLVNYEIGNAANYGSKFKLSIKNSIHSIDAAFRKSASNSTAKLMRVYTSGSMECGTSHLGYFCTAIEELGLMERNWKIEYLTVKNVRENADWIHPSFLINWCLDSDFHVVLCQGIHNGMLGLWQPKDCQDEMLKLEQHLGFPKGIQVHCPVLSADKFEYLCTAKEHCLPSFKFPLVLIETKLDEILESLKQFLSMYNSYEHEDSGFIIKAPYVQNQRGFKLKHFRTFADFLNLLDKIYNVPSQAFGKVNVYTTQVFPYLIIQPRINKKNESKIVLWNGNSQYICKFTQPSKISSKLHSDEDQMEFAMNAWKTMVDRSCGAFLCDGIVRVDLFCTERGNLVVNEFESLDASFFGTMDQESQTANFLQAYYVNMLRNL